MAQLRPNQAGGPKSEPLSSNDFAAKVKGEIVAPGVLRVETRFGLDYQHGNVTLSNARRENVVYFDTETTGLAGGTGTLAFMIGCARFYEDAFVATQWMLTEIRGEFAMLEMLQAYIREHDSLVSFNGKTFDAPLLATRFRLSRITDAFTYRNHLDLLHPVRRAFRRTWRDCRLATVEQELLGVERHNDLPGAMAPLAFSQWLRCGDDTLLPDVLNHNLLDVLSLATLNVALEDVYRAPVDSGADVAALARHALANGDEQVALDQLLQAGEGLSADGRRELARLYKRRKQWDKAISLWESLADSGCLHAMEELAKYAEHRARNFEVALNLTNRLMEKAPYTKGYQFRHARLVSKLKRTQPTG